MSLLITPKPSDTNVVQTTRGRSSSDMRDVSLLPESLLSPVATDDPPPVPPRPHRKNSNVPEKIDPPKLPYVPRKFSDPPLHAPQRVHASSQESSRISLQHSHSTPTQAQPILSTYNRTMSDARTRPPYPLPARSVSFSASVISGTTPPPNLSGSNDSSIEISPTLPELSPLSSNVFSSTPPITTDMSGQGSSYVIVDDDDLKQYSWYWASLSRY